MFALNYTITNELLNQIADIEALRGKISQARILPERAIELRYRATVEKVHDSTSIEGNPLTRKQVEAVLGGQNIARKDYAAKEVRNYKKALDWIDKRKLSGAAIQLSDLLELHRLAMKGLLPDEKTGMFRTGPIYIVDQDEKLKYTGPRAKTVQKKLDDLLVWLAAEQAVHPCIAAAVLHYQFLSIHPFADGNGRTARLLAMLCLGLKDYDFAGSIVLDTYYSQDREEYYDALHECQGDKYREGGDITSWISYFVTGFLSSAKILSAEIVLLSSLTPVLERKRISRDDADLLSYARQFGSISLSEAEDILPAVSRRTLQRKLKEFVSDGRLSASGAARNTRYHWVE